jgi:formate hydrogenlyase subunit 3/multisubunit Na+/H+ antiporter MnhD subunit
MTSALFISWLPLVALIAPIAMLVGCLFEPLRARMLRFLWFAPIPALAAACFAFGNPPIVIDWAPYHLMLVVDIPGALLLGTAALLWIAAGAYASEYLREDSNRERFTVWWLFTLTGSIGIFLAADIASFLLFYALVSLPAYGMIIHDGSQSVRRAGSIYMGFALLGESLILLAFVMLALIPHGAILRIADLVTAMSDSQSGSLIVPLLVVGFGMKIALVPLHFWMPLTYTAAPIPAAAVLSGAAVKAGLIGLIRFLPFGTPWRDWDNVLIIAGLTGAFFGVVIGVTQSNPKTVLAYSSVSQMGFLACLLGLGLWKSDTGIGMVTAFYAAHHVLVKGALFLAIGVSAATGKSRSGPVVLWPATVIALGLAGLPLTGGALVKLAAKGAMGYGFVGTLATFAAAGTTLLMFHFLHCLISITHRDTRKLASFRLIVPWFGLVVAAIAVPWATFSLGGIYSLGEVLTPSALWKVFWPLLVGGLLALVLRRWRARMPAIPNGDVVVLGGRVANAAAALGVGCGRLDDLLRRWQVAGTLLVSAIILLAVALGWC